MIAATLLMLAQAVPETPARQPSIAEMMATYHARTAAGVRCAAPDDSADITVCALRRADRWRLPLTVVDAGDPRHEGVPAERARLIAVPSRCAEKSLFLVGCGMAGMSVGTAGVHLAGERPLAP